jgi:hypothetical protein
VHEAGCAFCHVAWSLLDIWRDAGLLAEFGAWLDRERGLSTVSVRCHSKQARHFLAAVGVPGG